MRSRASGRRKLYLDSDGLASVRLATSAWLHSDLHREVLLKPTYDRAGISLADGTLDGYSVRLWGAHFGYRCLAPRPATAKREEAVHVHRLFIVGELWWEIRLVS